MEREPLPPRQSALAQAVGDLAGQRRGGRDPRLLRTRRSWKTRSPDLEKRMKTALAYLQRARYIQYRSGVGEEGLEPILYDVYEPR